MMVAAGKYNTFMPVGQPRKNVTDQLYAGC